MRHRKFQQLGSRRAAITPARGVRRARHAAALVLGLVAALALGGERFAEAQSASVPPQVQAELVSKLAGYDRNFADRAGDRARVLIVLKVKDSKSKYFAASLKGALGNVAQIGGLPHEDTLVPFDTAAHLAERCRSERAAVVYIAPGLDDDIPAIRGALTGVDVLSVSAIPENVPQGIVIGFELVSGKPKILVNLPQAKEQNVSFKAEVLKLMKVYR